jgi:hypothetical protein
LQTRRSREHCGGAFIALVSRRANLSGANCVALSLIAGPKAIPNRRSPARRVGSAAFRIKDARHHFHRRDRALFCRGNPLCSRLRALEIRAKSMNAANAALLIICALLLGYLLYTLLKAEEM